LFVREADGSFVRTRAHGWSDAHLLRIPAGDLGLAQLAAQREPVNLHELGWQPPDVPHGLLRPVVALPILRRRELHAFAFYGIHSSGDDFDRDEVAALAALAPAAASAFDHIEAAALRREIEDAEHRLPAQHGEPRDGYAPVPLERPRIEPDDEAPRPKRRRTIVLAALACLLAAETIGAAVPDLVRPWFPAGSAGISIDNDDFVTVVERGGPAARAGIAVGDRVDVADFQTRIIWDGVPRIFPRHPVRRYR
jgi:hypothetical protein